MAGRRHKKTRPTDRPRADKDSSAAAVATSPCQRRLTSLLLAILTVAMLVAAFPPFDLWFLAFAGLTPWVVMLGKARPKWGMLCAIFAGVFFWAVSVYWLWWVTMIGYIALVIYLSAYWLVGAVVVRGALRRGWGAWIVLPIVWVSLEYVRAYVITGFPWFYLAQSQYSRTALIQISDTTGQYGVSFFVAMVSGLLADVVLAASAGKGSARPRPWRKILTSAVIFAVVAGGLLGYGYWRLGQDTQSPGPVIGIVQQDFPISLNVPYAPQSKVFGDHLQATQQLVGKGCDLVIWPEGMLPTGLNSEWLTYPGLSDRTIGQARADAQQVGRMVKQLGCPLLAGGMSVHANPDQLNSAADIYFRNSALWFDPVGGWLNTAPYDNVHVVPFSECVPFRNSLPAFHRLLKKFVPAVMAQLEPGNRFKQFQLSRGNDQWQIASPICYEGTFARVCRRMVRLREDKSKLVLANISNDGWFIWQLASGKRFRSTEHAQHLAHYVFRAVENRVPVVRAVNTGISASVDSNGQIVAELSRHGYRTMVRGTLLLDGLEATSAESSIIHGPRVLVDSRVSVYSQVGDLFAIVVCVCGVVVIFQLWRKRRVDLKRNKN